MPRCNGTNREFPHRHAIGRLDTIPCLVGFGTGQPRCKSDTPFAESHSSTIHHCCMYMYLHRQQIFEESVPSKKARRLTRPSLGEAACLPLGSASSKGGRTGWK